MGDLTDRSLFTLLHCDKPMVYRGSTSTWQGTFPDGTSTMESRYCCDVCGATVDLKLVEPDQTNAAVVAGENEEPGEPNRHRQVCTSQEMPA